MLKTKPLKWRSILFTFSSLHSVAMSEVLCWPKLVTNGSFGVLVLCFNVLPCLVRFHFSEVKKPCLRSKLTLPSRWHVSRQKSGPILFPQQHTHRQHRWTTQILPNTLSTITIFKQKKLLVEIKYCAVYFIILCLRIFITKYQDFIKTSTMV